MEEVQQFQWIHIQTKFWVIQISAAFEDNYPHKMLVTC